MPYVDKLPLTGSRSRRKRTSSYSACAIPCASPPVDLPVDEQGIEDPAAVVDRDMTHQPRVAGLDVDLRDRHVRTERERRLQLAERPRRD
jgi:hypothetical protein